MTKGKLIMLCGLPSSGKDTLIEKELKERYDAVVLSSDLIREEIFGDINNQSDNERVFKIMYERAKQLLEGGKNVILNSTNTSRKKRIHLIQHELKASEYIVYYLNTRYKDAVLRDKNRNRTVGYEVIDRMFKTMEIPTKSEGWDEVHFAHSNLDRSHNKDIFEQLVLFSNKTHDDIFYVMSNLIHDFHSILELPQDSKYHSFSVSRHTYYVWDYIMKNYTGSKRKEMLVTAIFHDLGKAHTKSFVNYKGEEKRYASFIGHEYVSAQLACFWLSALGYDDNFIKYVVDLIQFHMKPMNMSEKQEKKLRKLLTEEQYSDLMFFHEADLSAK